MGNESSIKVKIEGENLLSSDLKQIESEFLQVEQAGKKTASSVKALFASMDDEQFSVQATWQRAMDDVKAATSKAVNDANREIEKLGKNISTDRLAGSFKDLGIKSALDISTEKARLVAAFEAIKKSGVASADEIRRAEEALQKQLKNIDGALDSNKNKANEASSGISTGLRGVVTWLAAAFTVDRVVAFTKVVFEASMALDSIVGKLKVMAGSDQGAAEELEFVRLEAQRLGLDLLETAKSYGTFMNAVKGTANEGKQSRAMFIGITEGMNAVRMTADEQSRAWAQLNQGIMKGKFEMEDLKSINEAGLPIFKLLAKALNISTGELMRMQTEGRLLADDALPKLAESMHKTFGKDAVEAASKGRAELNNFNTAIFELKAYLAESTGEGGGLSLFTDIVEFSKKAVFGLQMLSREIVAYVQKRIVLAKNLPSLLTGGAEAAADIKDEFGAIDAMTRYTYNQRKELLDKWSRKSKDAEKEVADAAKEGMQQTREEAEKTGQIRRDNAKKSGEELAKINVEYAKQSGGVEAQITADMQKQYEERKKATIDYWNQKKAAAKDNIEEASYEIIKNQKLQQIEAQHLRDIEVIQLAAKARRFDTLKDELALEALLVQEKVAKQEMTTAQGERRITELTVAGAKAQYDAKKAVADKYVEIYGQQGEDYKKLMKDQEAAHKDFLSASLAAQKTYAENIKRIDAEIVSFREGLQNKVRDLQQKGMTDQQKYADNQQRFNEAISKSNEAYARKDYETALKYNKQAEDMAGRLADKQATGNTELEKQAALKEGIANATQALNQVEQQGVQIMEAKKKENVDALATLEKIRDMKLDPKNLSVNMDQGALDAVKSQIADLTKDATKTIFIKTVGASGEASYSNTSTAGFFAGGKVSNGSPLQDSVSAMLARDEWVINNRATGFWGDDFLAGVNAPFSAAGKRLQAAMAGVSASSSSPALPNLGTISLDIGGGSFPVSAPIDVLSELNTALRRRKMSRPNP